MPSNNFPFARFPVEGAPHGSNVTIGPNPFDKPKGRRNDPPPTSPESANLIGWYDANNIGTLFQDTGGTVPVAANNDPVGDWHDANGGLKEMEQATAGLRPLYKTNILGGKPGIKFDGSDDVLVWSSVLSTANMDQSTVFLVLSGWTTGTYQGILGSTLPAGNDSYYLRISDVDKASFVHAGVAEIGVSTAAYSTAGAVIGLAYSDASSYAFYTGRTANGNGATAASISAASTIVGAQDGGVVERYTGYIHEILIYDSVLNATKIDNNARYLLNKWGL